MQCSLECRIFSRSVCSLCITDRSHASLHALGWTFKESLGWGGGVREGVGQQQQQQQRRRRMSMEQLD